jgi:hypothetical protein
MNNVACFCGRIYSFDGDTGTCPQCGEHAGLPRAPIAAEERMDDELERVLTGITEAAKARN